MEYLLSFLASLAVRSIVLAIVALAGIWILRVKSAAARHGVWAVVMAGMLALALFSPVLPPVSIPVLRAAPDTVFVFPETAPVASGDLVQTPAPPAAPPPSSGLALAWQNAVAALYLLGAIFSLARLAFGYLFTVRLVRAARHIPQPDADDVYESSWISVPLTVGWLRPKVLLPSGWQSWETQKLDAVFAHERTHIERADWVISLAAGLNRCIFWFHPVAWWLERTLASLAEQACDDRALLLVKSEHYAQALLDMAAAVKSGQGRLVWEAMAMAKAAEVKQRIERILDDTRQIPQRLTRARWAALLLFSVPLVYLAAVVRPVPALAQQQPKTPAEISDFLKGKRQLMPSDAGVMEQYLAGNPHDLDLRSQLVLYYFANGMRAERNNHILWLVANHPESNAAVIASLGISPRPNSLNDAPEHDRVAGLWKQQSAAHPNDTRILANAAQFFSQPGADYQEAERLLLAAAKMEPSNLAWKERLGKVYAKAILGATGDRAFPNSAPELAARMRQQLETSEDGWLLYYTGDPLVSVAQRPTAGKPLPEGVLNLDDHGLLLPAVDLGERLKARSGQFGVTLGMARTITQGAQPITRVVPAPPAPTAPAGILIRQTDGSAIITEAISQANALSNSLPPAPAPIQKVDPLYPPLARQARIQGIVKLSVTITSAGTVENIQVISGHPLLVPATLEAVRNWTFSGLGGKYLLTVPFELPPGEARPMTMPADTPRKSAAETGGVNASGTGVPSRIRVGPNVQAAQLTKKVDPAYPALARTARIEGMVTLQIIINEDGTVGKVDPVEGHPILLAAAAEAVRQWVYRPTLLNGQPVQVSTTVTIPFELNQ